MKRYIYVCALIISVAGAAYAAQTCVRLDAAAGCNCDNEQNASLFSCDCGGTTVYVVGQCAVTDGATYSSSVSVEVSDSNNLDSGNKCWCRMLRPAVSKWVRAPVEYNTNADCVLNCGDTCGLDMAFTLAMRSAMFSAIDN